MPRFSIFKRKMFHNQDRESQEPKPDIPQGVEGNARYPTWLNDLCPLHLDPVPSYWLVPSCPCRVKSPITAHLHSHSPSLLFFFRVPSTIGLLSLLVDNIIDFLPFRECGAPKSRVSCLVCLTAHLMVLMGYSSLCAPGCSWQFSETQTQASYFKACVSPLSCLLGLSTGHVSVCLVIGSFQT